MWHARVEYVVETCKWVVKNALKCKNTCGVGVTNWRNMYCKPRHSNRCLQTVHTEAGAPGQTDFLIYRRTSIFNPIRVIAFHWSIGSSDLLCRYIIPFINTVEIESHWCIAAWWAATSQSLAVFSEQLVAHSTCRLCRDGCRKYDVYLLCICLALC